MVIFSQNLDGSSADPFSGCRDDRPCRNYFEYSLRAGDAAAVYPTGRPGAVLSDFSEQPDPDELL